MKPLQDALDNLLKDYDEIYGHLTEDDRKKAVLETEQLVNELKGNKVKIRNTHKLLSFTTVITSIILSTFFVFWFVKYDSFSSMDVMEDLNLTLQFFASIAINYIFILIICFGISLYFIDYLKKRIDSFSPDFAETKSFEEKIRMLQESEKHTNRNLTLGIIAYAAIMLCILIYSPYLFGIFKHGNQMALVLVFFLTALTLIFLISRIALEYKLIKVQKRYKKQWTAHRNYYRNLKNTKDN